VNRKSAAPIPESATTSTIWRIPSSLRPSIQTWDAVDSDDETEDEPWLENPVLGAEELLRVSRLRQLLQP